MQQWVGLEIEMQSVACYDYFNVPFHSRRKEEVRNCVRGDRGSVMYGIC